MRSVKRGKGNYSKSHWEEKRHEGQQGKIYDDSCNNNNNNNILMSSKKEKRKWNQKAQKQSTAEFPANFFRK
jgi:hypothetical protein